MKTTSVPDHEIDVLSLLERLGNIDHNEIKTLRLKIELGQQITFDKLTDDEKRILTLFDSLPPDELKKLEEMENKHGKFVGIHGVRKRLHTLTSLTGNNRYSGIKK